MSSVEYLNKGKTMVKLDGVLFVKSRRRLKTEEQIEAARDKRRSYMKARREKIKTSLNELKSMKNDNVETSVETIVPSVDTVV